MKQKRRKEIAHFLRMRLMIVWYSHLSYVRVNSNCEQGDTLVRDYIISMSVNLLIFRGGSSML